MTILNFAHPITNEQKEAVEAIVGSPVQEVRRIHSHVDPQQPLVPQVVGIIDNLGYSAEQWQTMPFIVNLPSLSAVAGVVLAELHGRMGYFPPVLRMRPAEGSIPPRFQVAEVINLQEVRQRARTARAPQGV